MECFAEADSLWSFNLSNGSRKSNLKDISELDHLWREIRKACSTLSIRTDDQNVPEVIRELERIFADRSNFRWDKRSMKSKVAAAFPRVIQELKQSRESAWASIFAQRHAPKVEGKPELLNGE